MKYRRPHICYILLGTLLAFVVSPTSVFAIDYVSLSGLPGVNPQGASIAQILNSLFFIAISVAGLLAVIKITIAGVKYMFTDIVTSKSDAIKDINGALLGLGIIIASTLVLVTINPDLRNLDILSGTSNLRKIQGNEGQTFDTPDNSNTSQNSYNTSDGRPADGVNCADGYVFEPTSNSSGVTIVDNSFARGVCRPGTELVQNGSTHDGSSVNTCGSHQIWVDNGDGGSCQNTCSFADNAWVFSFFSESLANCADVSPGSTLIDTSGEGGDLEVNTNQ